MTRLVKSAFLAFVLGATALPAAADPVRTPYAIKVSTAGLDLATVDGAAAAMTRIEAGASKACGRTPSPRQIKAATLHRDCRDGFVRKAVAAIDAPVLTALYNRAAPARLAAR